MQVYFEVRIVTAVVLYAVSAEFPVIGPTCLRESAAGPAGVATKPLGSRGRPCRHSVSGALPGPIPGWSLTPPCQWRQWQWPGLVAGAPAPGLLIPTAPLEPCLGKLNPGATGATGGLARRPGRPESVGDHRALPAPRSTGTGSAPPSSAARLLKWREVGRVVHVHNFVADVVVRASVDAQAAVHQS